MGGNALKNTITERKNKQEYETIKTEILKILSEHIICNTILEVPEKKDFGDLDILYISNEKINIRELIIKLFNPNEIVINGTVISFDYNKFQIDLIKCPNKDYMEMANFYYSYGDLGSIIGRICNHYGLKFGHEGLWINVLENTLSEYKKDDKEKEIDISKNTTKIVLSITPLFICQFLDYNYEKWQKGFYTTEEIYKWIIESKYYNKNIFSILNHEHYQRAIKRIMYIDFLKFIGIDSVDRASIDKSYIKVNLQNLAITFFNKQKEVDEMIRLKNIANERKKKFNGTYLLELNIKQETIGEIIKKFKEYIKKEYNCQFEEWLDDNTHENIMNIFVAFYKN
jgi:hypothetical protein